jgi:prolipoprotein diacylglyceryl transferase
MSFHGALIGIIIGTYFFCKNKNQNIFIYLDVVAVCSPVGIFLGRISNFINSELYGIKTNVPWSVKFIKIDDLNRHPSQIYEAIFEGVILFIILNMLFNRLRKLPGIISGYFLILYSFFTFVIEFFREPDQQLGYLFFNLSMGQIITCIALTCGLIIIYYKNANRTQ